MVIDKMTEISIERASCTDTQANDQVGQLTFTLLPQGRQTVFNVFIPVTELRAWQWRGGAGVGAQFGLSVVNDHGLKNYLVKLDIWVLTFLKCPLQFPLWLKRIITTLSVPH